MLKRENFVSLSVDNHGYFRTALLISLIAILTLVLFLLPVKHYLISALEWTKGLGYWGPVFVVGFYILAAVLLLPGSVLTLGAGFLFGTPVGVLTVWVGANLGAWAAFLVGRTIARGWVANKVSGNPKFAAIDEAVGREGFRIVFLLRLSPIFPFNIMNYALGLTRVSFRDYVLASLVGMIPAIFMYVYLGSAARTLTEIAAGQTQEGTVGRIFFWLGLTATVLVTVLVTRIASRSLKGVDSMGSAIQPVDDKNPVMLDERNEIVPDDEYNQVLKSNVHPSNWFNPPAAEQYNLVVIGGGTAGLVTAAGAAGLGAKVALVEKAFMGGDCLNFGCVPSKALLRCSRVFSEISKAKDYGIGLSGKVQVDFGSVMERMRRLRSEISRHDSVKRFKELGVDVFFGHASFSSTNTVSVSGSTLRFKKAVIATGARAIFPDIAGLKEGGCLTNETVFSLTELPARLAIIGGGPLGCEMAQAFQRLGSQVTVFHKNDHILDREDEDAADIIQKRFIKEGVRLILNCELKEVLTRNSEKLIKFETKKQSDILAVDEILIGAGRAPNVEGLNLDIAGVSYDSQKGVSVDDNLRTTNPNIFAAGDVCMRHKFTHAADAAARIVIQNALFKGARKLSDLNIPWCTYTDPEIAHVGMYEEDATRNGLPITTYIRNFSEVDRAVLDGEEKGFVKIHVKKGTDLILGATIVASHAGDMINEITLAIVGRLGLKTLSGVIHPYPTQAEAIKQAADAYNRSRLTPIVKKILVKWFSWIR
jgi:pyruvate/2-oxoglutarate dehydrogenase complex dihydrolipoamide dehydrogenase (E3) component/uncharacterized membrane protein YdjX (TVP38/TMEM64 family)